MTPLLQKLMSRASVKSRISPADSSIIMFRPRMVAAVSRVRVSLGEAVVSLVPLMYLLV